MKAARMFGVRDVRVVDSPMPELALGEVLLRIRALAICASDLHMYEEGHSSGVYPSGHIILGHEFSGQAAEQARWPQRATKWPRCACGSERRA